MKKTDELKIPERDFQAQVIELARMTGWRVAHFRPAMDSKGRWKTAVAGDGAGFPDLVLARPGKLLFRELKSNTGKVEPEQVAWGDALRAAGADWAVWRPRDWPFIEQALMRRGVEGLE